jgi:hypothetical protein
MSPVGVGEACAGRGVCIDGNKQSSVCAASDSLNRVLRARAEMTVEGDNVVFGRITAALVFGV